MTREANVYFVEGCGRCPKGGSAQCKVHRWAEELAVLRRWMKEMAFTEECKWGVPCYTHQGRNLVLLSSLQDAVVLSFLEGSALSDPYGLLRKAGPNSVRDRVIRWKSMGELQQSEHQVKSLLEQHIKLSKHSVVGASPGAGSSLPTEGTPDYPRELVEFLKENPAIAVAFESLTPGRRRGFLLHFVGAAQSATRMRRILAAVPLIQAGKGMQGR